MNPNAAFFEQATLIRGFGPVNMATGANNGAWISMKNIARLTAVLFKGAGVAGDDPTIAFQQATAIAGTGAKDLLISNVFNQVHATTLTGLFTRSVITPAASYTSLTLAEELGFVAVDIQADDLDRDNGFDCVRATIASVGAGAQLGGLFYIAEFLRYAPPQSPILD